MVSAARTAGTSTFYPRDEPLITDEELASWWQKETELFLQKVAGSNPLYLAFGTSAGAFAALSYALILARSARGSQSVEACGVFNLEQSLIREGSLASTPPNPAIGDEASWSAVPQGQVDDAARFWAALTAHTPSGLNSLLADASLTPPAREAVAALAERFPDASNGLTTCDELLLAAIAEGRRDLGSIFEALRTPGHDSLSMPGPQLLLRLEHLSSGPTALVRAEGRIGFASPSPRLELTEHGSSVLEGRDSALSLLEHRYWVGGCFVTGGSSILVRAQTPSGAEIRNVQR